MIVILKKDGDETFHEDVAAVVCPRSGHVYLCRDGKPDEYIDERTDVVVVNDA